MSETAVRRHVESTGNWKTLSIGNVFEMQLGKMLSKAAKTGRNPKSYLANRNVQWDRADVSALEMMDFSESEQEKFSLRSGDLLVCEGGEVGRTCMWRGELTDCFFQKAIHRLRPTTSDVLPEYMLRLMRLLSDNGAFTAFTSQSSIAHLTREKLALVEIRVPPLPQQRKIARILTTLDNVIEKTEALIAKYQVIKQGLMHDLFTRGVDATGKLRPPQSEAPELYKQSDLGWIPKEWEINELRHYLSYISYGFTNPMPETEDGPWMLTAANIFDGVIQYATCRHTSQEAFSTLLTNKSRPLLNDILLTKDGTLGRVAIVDRVGICINQSVAVLRPNELASPQFLARLLQTTLYQEKMLGDAGGSTIKHIYITVVDQMLISAPKSHEEQCMIVERLTSAESRIKNAVEELGKRKLLKTGLMQDLLTGKVRVNVEVGMENDEVEGGISGRKNAE